MILKSVLLFGYFQKGRRKNPQTKHITPKLSMLLPQKSSHLVTAMVTKTKLYHQTSHTSAHASVTQATSSSLSLQGRSSIPLSPHLSPPSHAAWPAPSAQLWCSSDPSTCLWVTDLAEVWPASDKQEHCLPRAQEERQSRFSCIQNWPPTFAYLFSFKTKKSHHTTQNYHTKNAPTVICYSHRSKDPPKKSVEYPN